MGRHRCVPLLAILGRKDCAHGVRSWTTRCWDGDGRRSTLVVRLGFGFVAIEGPSFGPLYLAPAQAGALRGALRQVMLELGRLGGPRLPNRPRDVPEPEPVQRRKLRLLRPPPPRPTVADIEAKLRGLDQLAAETTRPITVEVWPVDDETVPRIPRQRAAPVAVPVPPTDTVPTPG